MIRSLLSVLSFLLLLALPPASVSSDPGSIIGVWRLVELTNWSEDGTQSKPFGEQPRGTFTYTPEGNLSIHIMRTPPFAKLTERPDDEQLAEFARGYLGYFGTYSVDYETGIVTHEVTGALNPNYVDTDRERAFSISGDTLTIDIRREDGARYLRRLERIETLD